MANSPDFDANAIILADLNKFTWIGMDYCFIKHFKHKVRNATGIQIEQIQKIENCLFFKVLYQCLKSLNHI